jgi:hypothetical protein
MKKLSILFAAFAVLFLVSCGKYEDGPGISLRSKASRIDGSWKVEKYTEDGTDFTSDYATLTFEFTKDGSFTISDNYLGQVYSETGSWELTSNDEDLTFTFSDGTTDVYKILRLTNSDFWISQTYSGMTDVIHLKAK